MEDGFCVGLDKISRSIKMKILAFQGKAILKHI
jgi:hypothetical protein